MENIDFLTITYAILFFVEMAQKNKYKKNCRNKIYKKNYKLYKCGIYSDTYINGILPNRTFREILELERYFDTKYPNEIKEIFSKFVNYIDPINLESCLRNIGKVNIKNKHSIKERLDNYFSTDSVNGKYYISKNLIELYSKNKLTLSHEFLHMASSSRKFPSFSGFLLNKYDYLNNEIDTFGIGLNEGYTELLNLRIFNNGKLDKAYIKNVKIVKLIECFFDDYREMEYAYFHNNIDTVYKTFCKYGTREEYFMIMNELDKYAEFPTNKDYLNSIRIQLKLYEIIKRSNDENKINNFKKALNDNLHNKLNIAKKLNYETIEQQFKKTR